MAFKRQKQEYIHSVEEFNELLRIAKRDHRVICQPRDGRQVGHMAYLDDRLVKTELTMKHGDCCTYIFNKDCRKDVQEVSGLDAYILLAKDFAKATGYQIPTYEDPSDIGSAVPILGYRKEYNQKRVQAYSMDQNSAYAWAMSQPMPDTRMPAGRYREVQEGELGFIIDTLPELPGFETSGNEGLIMVLPGRRAEVIFKAIPSPFKNFAKKWYSRKQNPATKDRAKQMLCYSVGYLQRKNPYLRAAILTYANNYIASLVDENTIYINTDCIVSLVPRNDLPIGTELGEFKIDHQGEFAFSGYNYQWNREIPAYRGIPKTWFTEGWDILKDPPPCNRNKYELNMITLQMEETHYDCHTTH